MEEATCNKINKIFTENLMQTEFIKPFFAIKSLCFGKCTFHCCNVKIENGSRLHVNQILGLIRGSLRKKALATHKMLSSARQSKNYANLCVCAMGVPKILSQFSLILASRKIDLEARKRKFTNLLFFCFLIKLTRIFVSSARVICC